MRAPEKPSIPVRQPRINGRYSHALDPSVAAMASQERPGTASNTGTPKRSATTQASQRTIPPSAAFLRTGSLHATVPATIACVATTIGTAATKSIR